MSNPFSRRYEKLFKTLKQKQQAAFIPFVTLGDPNPDLSFDLIKTLIESGADALELGFPFSDPVADGPVIQSANLRALKSNTTSETCFNLIGKLRNQYPDIPIGLLVYANLVFAPGLEYFYKHCQSSGVDSVLIADVPLHESGPFRHTAQQFGIQSVYIAPPNARTEKLTQIARLTNGYTYLLSRSGVTGTDQHASQPDAEIISQLTRFKAPPLVMGFGISRPEQIKQNMSSGISGFISGSALVKIIEQTHHTLDLMHERLTRFTQEMKAATHL